MFNLSRTGIPWFHLKNARDMAAAIRNCLIQWLDASTAGHELDTFIRPVAWKPKETCHLQGWFMHVFFLAIFYQSIFLIGCPPHCAVAGNMLPCSMTLKSNLASFNSVRLVDLRPLFSDFCNHRRSVRITVYFRCLPFQLVLKLYFAMI